MVGRRLEEKESLDRVPRGRERGTRKVSTTFFNGGQGGVRRTKDVSETFVEGMVCEGGALGELASRWVGGLSVRVAPSGGGGWVDASDP